MHNFQHQWFISASHHWILTETSSWGVTEPKIHNTSQFLCQQWQRFSPVPPVRRVLLPRLLTRFDPAKFQIARSVNSGYSVNSGEVVEVLRKSTVKTDSGSPSEHPEEYTRLFRLWNGMKWLNFQNLWSCKSVRQGVVQISHVCETIFAVRQGRKRPHHTSLKVS